MSWQRYWTAWSRYHHSSGFGIHSPYAYRFVRHVWRQPLPYYAYEGIHQLIDTVKAETTREQRREMDLIDEREARLLFRVTNFFNPGHFLQVGARTGVESVAMMAVSHTSRLHLLDPQLEPKALAVRVLHSQLDRVECYNDEAVAIGDFLDVCHKDEGIPLALINVPVEDSADLKRLIDSQVVIVMRNLLRNGAMRDQYDTACTFMDKGQTYTNGKIAVLIPNPKLQREDFMLWL